MKKNLTNAAAAAEAAAASLMKQIVVTATAHLRIVPPAMGPQRVSNPKALVSGSAASFEERQVILGEQLETMPLEVDSVLDSTLPVALECLSPLAHPPCTLGEVHRSLGQVTVKPCQRLSYRPCNWQGPSPWRNQDALTWASRFRPQPSPVTAAAQAWP